MAVEPLDIAPLGSDTATPLSLRRRVDLIEELVPIAAADVLDCGCGEGSYVVELSRRGARARGIEFQPEKVAAFRREHPGDSRVSEGDVERLAFADESFDVVLMNETIEHFPDDRAALRSARRVLREDGALVVLAPNRWYPFESHGVYWKQSDRLLSPALPGVPYVPQRAGRRVFRYWARNYWPRELRARIEAEGFEIVRTGFLWQTFEGISGQQPRVVRVLAPFLRRVAWRAERTPGVRRFGVTQWVVARKREPKARRYPALRGISRRFRQRRFAKVRELLSTIPKPFSVLDVGGTEDFWRAVGMCGEEGVEVTLLNPRPAKTTAPNMTAVVGSGCDMPQFANGQFDVVFSNSVIEHVGGRDAEQCMAREVRRVGRRYVVQTPNKYFPIEPHFVMPFFALLPLRVRTWLMQHFRLGWVPRIPDRKEAEAKVSSVRLLTRQEFHALFPEARLTRERVAGMTKSFSVYGGDWARSR